MISVKTGTQTWSKADQRTDFDTDNRRTTSADQSIQHFGDQDLGQILNQVADPNYIDPTKAARQVGNNQLDKDAFMKLLLTQMKNQDPTNPMQSHEMAAQLAQFTSLEKLTNINDSILALQKAQAPMQNFESLNLIGKAVSGDSSRIDRMAEGDLHPVSFELPQDAARGEVVIKNANGEVVRKLALSKLQAGKNEITWNGQNEEGRQTPVGTYTVQIEAIGNNGSKLGVNTQFAGLISAVSFTAQGPVLTVGKKQVPLKEIKEIRDPKTFENNIPKTQEALQVKRPQGQVEQVAEASQPQPQASPKAEPNKAPDLPVGARQINDLAMSQGLINQLNREGVKAGM